MEKAPKELHDRLDNLYDAVQKQRAGELGAITNVDGNGQWTLTLKQHIENLDD